MRQVSPRNLWLQIAAKILFRCRRHDIKCYGSTTRLCKGCVEARHKCTYKGVPRLSEEAFVLGAQARREVLLEKVVRPLRMALHLIDWDASDDRPEVIPLRSTREAHLGPLHQLRRSHNAVSEVQERVSSALSHSLMLRKITNYRIQSPPRRWPRQNPVSFYDDESLPEGVLSLK